MVFFKKLFGLFFFLTQFLLASDNTFIQLQDFDFKQLSHVKNYDKKNISIIWGSEFTTHTRALGGYFSPSGNSTFHAGARRGDGIDIPKVNMVATEDAAVGVTLRPRRSVRSMYVEAVGLQATKNMALSLGLSLKEVRHELNADFAIINNDQRACDRFSQYLHGALEQTPPNGVAVQSYLENNKFYEGDKRLVGVDFLSLALCAPWHDSSVEVGIKIPGHRHEGVTEWMFSPTFSCKSPSIYGVLDWSSGQFFGWNIGAKTTLELQAGFMQKRVLQDFEHAWGSYQLLGIQGQDVNSSTFTPAANVFNVLCSVKNRWKGELQFSCQKHLMSNFSLKALYAVKFSEYEKIKPDHQNFTQNNYGFVDTLGFVLPGVWGNNAADFDGGIDGSWIRPNNFALNKSIDKGYFLHSMGIGLQAPRFYGVAWHVGMLADFDFVSHERNKIGFFCEISRFFA